jgi:putative methionine-R-sulfoxide reductase with GAF domain
MKGELGKIYADGEVIFNEGDGGEVMYVIQSGRVTITKKTESDESTVLATLQDGDIFGEMALFDKQTRSATATASGEARILSIDKKKLFSSISRDPTLVFKLLESMSRRIRRLNDDLTQFKKTKFDALHACIKIDDTCTLVLEEAKNLVSADNGSVMLLDEKEQALIIKAAFGKKSESTVRFTVGEGIAGNVLSSGRAELVNNVSMDQRYKAGTTHIKSMICIPLKCNDKNIGVMNMSNNTDALFTLEDLKILNALSFYASVAIENARNFSTLRDASERVLRHASLLDV